MKVKTTSAAMAVSPSSQARHLRASSYNRYPVAAECGLDIVIPASLASGAHQAGEESLFVISRVARALDPGGSSRASLDDLEALCETIFSRKQYGRLMADSRGERYWTKEPRSLLLRSEAKVLASHAAEREILASRAALTFPIEVLDTRPRRGAAILAAMLAGNTDPISHAFIQRFARVDRGTIGRWMRDTVISDQILARHAEYALGDARRVQLPNSWISAAESGRSSFRLNKSLSSCPSDSGAQVLRRRYYNSLGDLAKAVLRRHAAGADVLREFGALGSIYVKVFEGWRQFGPLEALAPAGVSPQSRDTSHHHDRDKHACTHGCPRACEVAMHGPSEWDVDPRGNRSAGELP